MASYIAAIICGFLIIGVDQYTKYLIISNYTALESYDFIKGFMDITYLKNDGGAWGMLSGNTWLLLSLTIVIMIVCIALLLKVGIRSKLMFWAITLVMAGGIGNMIDRVFRGGNVVDFLHFLFMPSFPVFNVADCAIVTGAGLLIVYFLIEMLEDNKKKKLAEVKGNLPTNNNEKN